MSVFRSFKCAKSGTEFAINLAKVSKVTKDVCLESQHYALKLSRDDRKTDTVKYDSIDKLEKDYDRIVDDYVRPEDYNCWS